MEDMHKTIEKAKKVMGQTKEYKKLPSLSRSPFPPRTTHECIASISIGMLKVTENGESP